MGENLAQAKLSLFTVHDGLVLEQNFKDISFLLFAYSTVIL